MSDLISRKALLEEAEYDENYRLIVPIEKIKHAPIAYDVDKVVEQLEEAKENRRDECGIDEFDCIDYESAIEIVKGGGVDEN